MLSPDFVNYAAANRSKIARNDRVSETNPLGGSRSLLRCCGQGLPTVPRRPADEFVLASTQSEKIQAVLCSSTYRILFPDPTAERSMSEIA